MRAGELQELNKTVSTKRLLLEEKGRSVEEKKKSLNEVRKRWRNGGGREGKTESPAMQAGDEGDGRGAAGAAGVLLGGPEGGQHQPAEAPAQGGDLPEADRRAAPERQPPDAGQGISHRPDQAAGTSQSSAGLQTGRQGLR